MDPNNPIVDLAELTNPTSSNSPTSLLWNESLKDEDTFLQNLFANTLLSDDFSKKPELDLGLGFDNLQLNYDPNPALNLTDLNPPQSEPDPLLIIQDLKLTPTINEFITSSELSINNDDEKIFKKPSNDFLSLSSTNNKQIIKSQKLNLNLKKSNKLLKEIKNSNSNSSSSSNSNQIIDNINKLKRSRKKSKNQLDKSNPKNITNSSPNNIIKQKLNNHQKLLCNKTIFKLHTQHTFEPLNKKFAPCLTLKSNNIGQILTKELDKNLLVLSKNKDEVADLHIKELSLLDLHSSEDDSSGDFAKKNNLKLKQIELNSEETESELNKLSTNPNNLNEIISKRVKYSNLEPNDSISTSNFINFNSQNEDLNKFIKYFESLDNNDNKETRKKNLQVANNGNNSSKKSLDSLLSPPSPSNFPKTQYKRKKKENEQQNQSVVLISLKEDCNSSSTKQNIPNNKQVIINLENDTLQHMKNLDLNNKTDAKLDLSDKNSRNYLWNLLKTNSTQDELIENFGSILHDKISFWDLVQIKLKHSKTNHLKTTYQIIDDYTLLYSNMSALLEKIVSEQSNFSLSMSSKGENSSSRSRSSSKNFRKQSTSSSNR